MSVQDDIRTLTIPAQAGPVDPPRAPAPPRAVRHPVGRDRPLTADERQCLIGLTLLTVVLGSIIVTFLLLAERVWT